VKYNSRFKLTPCPATNRWRKIHKGKTYYVGVGHCSSGHDRAGYKIAIAEWRDILDKLESVPTPEEEALYREHLENERWLEEENSRTTPVKVIRAHGRIYSILPPPSGYPIEVGGKRYTTRQYDDMVAKAIAKVEGRAVAKDTIGAAVVSFLATKRERHALGELSASRVRTCEQHLRTVEDVLGNDSPLSSVDEQAVKRYWLSLADHVKAGDYGRTTAADRWVLFKEWVRSLYSIPLPRNLDSSDFSIRKPTKKVVVWNVEEVRQTLSDASEQLRCWLLLLLNCGMYAGDVSDLKPSEVDWERGRIKRKRSKTARLDSVPTVDYPLWQTTFSLLRKFGSRTDERVFSDKHGGALVQQHFKKNGKMKNRDSIYDCYRRAFKDSYAKRPLKSLRKTGASMLDSHDIYFSCVEAYLGHAVKTVTDRSYLSGARERFDSAIRWLGERFGIE
jgi:integrase